MGCTILDFIGGMVNNYKKNPNTVGWINQFTPVVNVTSTVAQVKQGVNEAYLVIHGDKPERVLVYGPYDEEPQPIPVEARINNWLKGQEWERQKCQSDGKHYWVVYPAELYINKKPGAGITASTALLLAIGAAALIALSQR